MQAGLEMLTPLGTVHTIQSWFDPFSPAVPKILGTITMALGPLLGIITTDPNFCDDGQERAIVWVA